MRKNLELDYVNEKIVKIQEELNKAQTEIESLSSGKRTLKFEKVEARVARLSKTLAKLQEEKSLIEFLPEEINAVFAKTFAKNLKSQYVFIKTFKKIVGKDFRALAGVYAHTVEYYKDQMKKTPIERGYPEIWDTEKMKELATTTDYKQQRRYGSLELDVKRAMNVGEKYYASPLNYVKFEKAAMIEEYFKMKITLALNIKKYMNKVEYVSLWGGDVNNMDVHGDTGSIRLQVVLAGGYNIQRLHTRFLINPLGPKQKGNASATV